MQTERTANEIEHSRAVCAMFSGIATKYDLLNHVLSVNIDKRWRRLVREKLSDILANEKAVVLDVACGTGDLSLELQKHANARVIGTDFCRPMLTLAHNKTESLNLTVPYIEADAMDLAFANESFDAVTIAFGLRNLSNFQNGLRELQRVLKNGGKLAVLEFSTPLVPGFRSLFNLYFTQILPRVGGMISGSRGAYEYLPDSVSKFPDQKHLVDMMSDAGFADVEYKNLTGGIAAIHTGIKSSEF